MASFCTNCGSPISGRFCAACGAPIQEGPASVAHPAHLPEPAVADSRPAAGVSTNSGAKVLLVVLGGVLLLGAMGVATIIYAGYRAKQRITELKAEYQGTGETSSMRKFPPSQGNGCRMLEGREAAEILGIAVQRAEFDPNGPGETQICRYWVSATERQRLVREEVASSLAGLGKAEAKASQPDIENLIGGAAGALNEVNGYNKNTEYAFSLQVWQKNGKEQWNRMALAQARTQEAMGTDVAGVAMQSAQGIGDQAIELPAGHSIMVLKGDAFFLLGFQQFVPGKEKTAALARIVAGRI